MTFTQTRLKHLCTLVGGGTPKVDIEANWAHEDSGTAWVSIGDMSGVERVKTTARRISSVGIKDGRLRIAPPGTLLFSMYASLGHTAVLDVEGTWNQAILGVLPRVEVDMRFLQYSLISLRPYLVELARSNTQANLNAEQVGNLPVLLPTFEEQRRIADFLDAETVRIDALGRVQQHALIRLLERRRAVIHSSVTGASVVERRRTALAWARTLPADWSEAKLSLVAKMGSGHTPSRSREDWWIDCTVPWITTGEVSQVRDDRVEEIVETREKVSEVGLTNSAAERCPKGTVVLCRTASAGYSAIMGTSMATSQDFVTWQCGSKLDPFYLLWCLRAMRTDLLGRLAMGSTHKTIYVPDLQMLRIPLPPLTDQQRIVEHIRRNNRRTDTVVDAIRRQTELIAERQQVIITAAVSGQFDVTTARGPNLS